MAASPPEAFLLLALHNATAQTPAGMHTGTLHLKCVTISPQNSSAYAGTDREVFLVLSINSFESPIDPSRVVHVSRSSSGQRVYTFDGTDDDPSDLVLTITPPPSATAKDSAGFEEDVDTFDSVIAQYADLRRQGLTAPTPPVPTSTAPVVTGVPEGKRDFRGQLIVVNEANGEFLGEVDKKFSIHEDPVLHERGHENDAVIIEVPEGSELDAFEIFARAVPPEDHHWITQSATIISRTITSTTNLLVTSITHLSTFYTSVPSSSAPPPLPPRALAFLSSTTARRGLKGVHSLSEGAVQVSAKTVSLINGMINRAVGGKGKKNRRSYLLSPNPNGVPYARSPSPSPGATSPPPYSPSIPKPSLPPRSSPSPLPSMPQGPSSAANVPPPLPPRTLSTKDRIILSADLILATIDESAKQLLDVGGEKLSAVVGHKYGPVAAENTRLATGTVKNAVLIYIDMKGVGRRALMRTVGKEFVKARVRK